MSDNIEGQDFDSLPNQPLEGYGALKAGQPADPGASAGIQQDPIPEMAATMAAGPIASAAKDAGAVIGNEIGSVGPGAAQGLLQKAYALFPQAQSVEDLAKAIGNSSMSEAHPIAKAVQQALNRSKGYADGGEVSDIPQDFDSMTPDSTPTTQEMQPEGQDFDSLTSDEDKYSTLGQKAITAGESFGQGLFGPAAPAAEKALGVDPKDILARQQINPITHYAAEVAGLAAPALVTGGMSLEGRAIAAAAPEATSSIANLAKFTQTGILNKLQGALGIAGGDTLAGQIGAGAAKAAIDNALISGSDEASKLVLQDPNQSAQTAMADIGLSTLLGGALGAVGGGTSALWKANNGSKASQFLADFKGRIADHVAGKDEVQAVSDELGQLYSQIKEEPVYGPNGIKATALAKNMPELSQGIVDQVQEHIQALEDGIRKLDGDPNQRFLVNELAKFKQGIATDSPMQLFDVQQQLKQNLQTLAKYDKIPSLAQKDFMDVVKPLAAQIREGLEDNEVWGKAGDIQKTINSNFAGLQQPLKKFEQSFIKDGQLNPDAVRTAINQFGQGKGAWKASRIGQFVTDAQNYKDAIDTLHGTVGEDSPFAPLSLNNTFSALKEKTTGAKAADQFIKTALSHTAGSTLGGALGAGLGHAIGLGGAVGGLFGVHALGPIFNSVIPSVAKSVFERPVSAEGGKAAVDFALSAYNGQNTLTKAAKALFKGGTQVIPESLQPSDKSREKLNKLVQSANKNPQQLFNSNNTLNKYLPDHAQAMTQSMGTVISYLNSIKAPTQKQAPLDSTPILSSSQKAAYNNALDIAESPMTVLARVSNGSITLSDIQHLSTMYPGLYQNMKSTLSNQMAEHLSKGNTVPYKTRVGLSMFLGQPLDSTMSPQSIIAAQPQAQQPQQPAPMPKKRQSGARPSSPALQKLPGMYQTAEQARIARQDK